MIKTNILNITKTITFHGSRIINSEYIGKSFQYIDPIGDDSKSAGRFIDWVYGSPGNYTKEVGDVAFPEQYTIDTHNLDTKFLNRGFTSTLREYVEQKVWQKLSIHREELDYKFEDVINVGIPYLDKLSTEELDLFIKDAILSVLGVKEISKYIGSVIKEDNNSGKLKYEVKFELLTEEDEKVWQSIEI